MPKGKLDKSKLTKKFITIFDKIRGAYVKGVQVNPNKNKDVKEIKNVISSRIKEQQNTGKLRLDKELKNSPIFQKISFRNITKQYKKSKGKKYYGINRKTKNLITEITNKISNISFFESSELLKLFPSTRGYLFESIVANKLGADYAKTNNILFDLIYKNVGLQIKHSTNGKKIIDFENLNKVDDNIISRYNFEKEIKNLDINKLSINDAKNLILKFLKLDNNNLQTLMILEHNELIKNLGLFLPGKQVFSEQFIYFLGILKDNKVNINLKDSINNAKKVNIFENKIEIIFDKNSKLELNIDKENSIFELNYKYDNKIKQTVKNKNGNISMKTSVDFMDMKLNKTTKTEIQEKINERRKKYKDLIEKLDNDLKNKYNILDDLDRKAVIDAFLLTNNYNEFKEILKSNNLDYILQQFKDEENIKEREKLFDNIGTKIDSKNIKTSFQENLFIFKTNEEIPEKIDFAYNIVKDLPNIANKIKVNFKYSDKNVDKLLKILNKNLANNAFKGEFGEMLNHLLLKEISKGTLLSMNNPKIDGIYLANNISNLSKIYSYNLNDIKNNNLILQMKTIMENNNSNTINLTFTKLNKNYTNLEKGLLQSLNIKNNKQFISINNIKNIISEENLINIAQQLENIDNDKSFTTFVEGLRKLQFAALIKHISIAEINFDGKILNMDKIGEDLDKVMLNNIDDFYLSIINSKINKNNELEFSNYIYSLEKNNIFNIKNLSFEKVNKIKDKFNRLKTNNSLKNLQILNFLIQQESKNILTNDFSINQSGNNIIMRIKKSNFKFKEN